MKVKNKRESKVREKTNRRKIGKERKEREEE